MGIVWSGANFLGHPTSSSSRINFCLDSQNINNLLKCILKILFVFSYVQNSQSIRNTA